MSEVLDLTTSKGYAVVTRKRPALKPCSLRDPSLMGSARYGRDITSLFPYVRRLFLLALHTCTYPPCATRLIQVEDVPLVISKHSCSFKGPGPRRPRFFFFLSELASHRCIGGLRVQWLESSSMSEL